MNKSLSHKVLNQRMLKAVKYIDSKEIKDDLDAAYFNGFEMMLSMLEDRPPVFKPVKKKSKFSLKKSWKVMKWKAISKIYLLPDFIIKKLIKG